MTSAWFLYTCFVAAVGVLALILFFGKNQKHEHK